MVTDLVITSSNAYTTIIKELFTNLNIELTDISKLQIMLDKNEDVKNLINLFSNQTP